ncbi:hypothetical protein [Nocardia puris]|uniref:hypothetical protein n=1 Tax=Nocardia puris TaxID=208602 RepID=UPI002E2322B2
MTDDAPPRWQRWLLAHLQNVVADHHDLQDAHGPAGDRERLIDLAVGASVYELRARTSGVASEAVDQAIALGRRGERPSTLDLPRTALDRSLEVLFLDSWTMQHMAAVGAEHLRRHGPSTDTSQLQTNLDAIGVRTALGIHVHQIPAADVAGLWARTPAEWSRFVAACEVTEMSDDGLAEAWRAYTHPMVEEQARQVSIELAMGRGVLEMVGEGVPDTGTVLLADAAAAIRQQMRDRDSVAAESSYSSELVLLYEATGTFTAPDDPSPEPDPGSPDISPDL